MESAITGLVFREPFPGIDARGHGFCDLSNPTTPGDLTLDELPAHGRVDHVHDAHPCAQVGGLGAQLAFSATSF
jgi:hypothetical protein